MVREQSNHRDQWKQIENPEREPWTAALAGSSLHFKAHSCAFGHPREIEMRPRGTSVVCSLGGREGRGSASLARGEEAGLRALPYATRQRHSSSLTLFSAGVGPLRAGQSPTPLLLLPYTTALSTTARTVTFPEFRNLADIAGKRISTTFQ
jgi:hypothetical protein